MKYQQAPLPVAPPDCQAYLESLARARELKNDQAACLDYLNSQLTAGVGITIHDVRTIWRGLYSTWRTPF